jgi:hypothetical protein
MCVCVCVCVPGYPICYHTRLLHLYISFTLTHSQGAVDSNDIKAFGRHNVMLDGFGVVCTSLGQRCKNYLPQVAGLIKWYVCVLCVCVCGAAVMIGSS